MERRASILVLSILLTASGSIRAQSWDPWSEVRVITDTDGVPHVLAETEDALWFASGYVYTDRVGRFQPYLAQQAAGRLAEVLGPTALEGDVQTRLAGVWEFAREHYSELPAQDRRAMERYCEGVEAYRSEFPGRFPDAVEPCAAQDLMAALDLWMIQKAVGMARERGEFDALNSNMWAVAPDRTTEGFAIYSGNPHVHFDDITIEMHLVGPLTDVYGISIGLFAFSGANPSVAWSETTNFTDAADVYRIELDASDPESYPYDGELRHLEKRDETFAVLQPDGSKRDVVRTLRWSHHGPVVSYEPGNRVAWAVRTTQADQVYLYTQYREQMRAANVAEFQRSLRYQARSTVNLGCADIDGNIGYVWLGRAARRPPGIDFTRPVSGNTSATEWGPFYRFEELPQVVNPASGFFQNCNNAAWLVTPSGEIGRDFPPEMVPPFTGGRVGRPRRALEILEEPGRRFSVEDIKRMAVDVEVVNGLQTIDYLDAMLPGTVKGEPEIAAAMRLLHEWSGYATVENRALYLLTLFCWRWDELGDRQNRPERALREAIAFAVQQRGRLDVPWGEVHGVERGGAWYPSGGASNQRGPVGSLISLHHGEPIRQRPDEEGRFPMQKGSSHVFVAQMTDPPVLWSAKPYGNNADPKSRHHADLTELFAAGRLRRVWTTRQDILAHAESVLGRGVELPLPGGLGRLVTAPGALTEVSAVPERANSRRIRIAEEAGRPLSAELHVDAAVRFRLLGSHGDVVQDWQAGGRPVRVVGSTIVEFAAKAD